MIEYLSGQSLEEVLTDELIIVDFFATWCGPCQIIGEELAELKDTKIIKIDVDSHPEIAKQHGVMSIPTIEIYKNKELKTKFIGLKSLDEIQEIISKI